MAHIHDNQQDPGKVLIAELTKAVKNREPWLIDAVTEVAEAERSKLAATLTGLNARLDRVLEAVENPRPDGRHTLSLRQVDEQMDLAALYSAAARGADDLARREQYRSLADQALRDRAP